MENLFTLSLTNITLVRKAKALIESYGYSRSDNWERMSVDFYQKKYGNGKTIISLDGNEKSAKWEWSKDIKTPEGDYKSLISFLNFHVKVKKPKQQIYAAGYKAEFIDGTKSVKLGCQTVPRETVAAIARRLGYTVKDKKA